MSETGCFQDGVFLHAEVHSGLTLDNVVENLPGYISMVDTDNNITYIYPAQKGKGNCRNLIISDVSPNDSGLIEDKIVEWSYLNSMQPYYVPTHLDATGGAAFTQEQTLSGIPTPTVAEAAMNQGYAADSTLLLMLSNLRHTYPLEMYNGVSWTEASDVATFKLTTSGMDDATDTIAGLTYKGDQDADNQTIEITPGITASSPCALKAQTDSGYIEASFMSPDISDFDLVTVGFRKVEAYNQANFAARVSDAAQNGSTGDPEYTDFAIFGVIGSGDAGKIHSCACLNGDNSLADAFTTSGNAAAYKDSDVTVQDSDTFIVRVELNTDGSVTYKYANNVACTTSVNEMTSIVPDGITIKGVKHIFDANDIVIPFLRIHTGSASDKVIYIKSIRMGRLN